MFPAITQNRRSRPLVSHEVIVNLISNTTTQTGLRIEADLDANLYPVGIKVTDDELAQVCIETHSFHGE